MRADLTYLPNPRNTMRVSGTRGILIGAIASTALAAAGARLHPRTTGRDAHASRRSKSVPGTDRGDFAPRAAAVGHAARSRCGRAREQLLGSDALQGGAEGFGDALLVTALEPGVEGDRQRAGTAVLAHRQ